MVIAYTLNTNSSFALEPVFRRNVSGNKVSIKRTLSHDVTCSYGAAPSLYDDGEAYNKLRVIMAYLYGIELVKGARRLLRSENKKQEAETSTQHVTVDLSPGAATKLCTHRKGTQTRDKDPTHQHIRTPCPKCKLNIHRELYPRLLFPELPQEKVRMLENAPEFISVVAAYTHSKGPNTAYYMLDTVLDPLPTL